MSEENPTYSATRTSTHSSRNRVAQVFSTLLTLAIISAIAWMIYDIFQLKGELSQLKGEISQLKGYVDSLVPRLDSAESRLSRAVSAISSVESELSFVGALARNANNYAHSHYSDVRMKQNIANLDDGLENILRLRVVTFNWNTDEFPEMGFSTQTQIGLIAQEVEQIYPELVSVDANGYKVIDYANLTPIIVGAIKEQQIAIRELQKQNAELERHLTDLENTTDSIK